MLFDDHDRVSTRVHHRLRPLALGEPRIHRHHAARQDALASHRLDLCDLMGFGGDRLWRERQP
jgi:hypothetical protein